MIIHEILKNNNNYKLLEKFIAQKHPIQFRYYTFRNIDVIQNHKLTIIGIIDDNPIAYGHIDHEKGINWIGLCVLNDYQDQGYGKKIFSYLMNYANKEGIKNIQLSVDVDNYRALNLYLKHNFKISNIVNKHYIMEYKLFIELPVSTGEALDKLTILDIKMKKITDNRRKDVEKEYNILNSKLEKYKEKYIFYYDILLIINESIWDMQDKFRESCNAEEQNNLCIQIIKENDNRFRVKKKINNISNSNLKEQKGYKSKIAFVLTHLGLGDNITAIGAVRYLSTCYDKVVIVCKEKNIRNMELFYNDDKTIELYSVISDGNISPNYGYNHSAFHKITKDMDVYLSGDHIINKNHEPYTDIPFNFYRDMNIDVKYFWDYFRVNIPKESKSLFDKLNNQNYIFIHNISSIGIAFTIEEIEKKFNLNRQKTLIINPNINAYKQTDLFFKLAEEFLNHPLAFYISTIINANKIIMTDSSFFCLSLHLSIKTSEIYLKPRNNQDYSYLYKKEYYDPKLNKSIFKLI